MQSLSSFFFSYRVENFPFLFEVNAHIFRELAVAGFLAALLLQNFRLSLAFFFLLSHDDLCILTEFSQCSHIEQSKIFASVWIVIQLDFSIHMGKRKINFEHFTTEGKSTIELDLRLLT